MASDKVIPFERRTIVRPPDDFDTPRAIGKCKNILDAMGKIKPFGEVYEGCVVLLLINLNDLLQKAKADGKPVTFTDQVGLSDDVKNVSDLVSKCRNAACHIRSKLHRILGDNIFTFNVIAGYMPKAFVRGNITYGCDFHDDIAIYYGEHRLYLRRHVARAIAEVEKLYAAAHP